MRLTGPGSISERWAAFVVGRPWWTLLVTVLMSVGIGLGATHFELSADYRIFFAETDPRAMALEELEATFARTDNVVFVVRPRSGDVFNARTMEAVRTLTDRAWTMPHVRRVDSMTNHQHSHAEGEAMVVEPLVPTSPDAAALERLREVALNEPLLVGGLLAADGGAVGVNALLQLDRAKVDNVVATASAARALVAEVSAAYPELDIRVSGLAMLNEAFMNASVSEMSWVVPLMALIILAGLLLALRSVAATLAIVGTVGLASSVALGVGGWLGYPLTPISASAPTIIITLSVADGVHLVLGARAAQRAGMDPAAAMRHSLAHNFKPVLLTSLSTMIGFLALNFGDSPPYWHMANMTSAGVFWAFLISVTFLPAVLTLWPPSAGTPPARWIRWEALAHTLVRLRMPILVVTALMSVLAIAAARTLETNDDFVTYFDESVPWRVDTEFMMEHLGGLYVVDFQIPADDASGVTAPAYLSLLDRFATYLRSEPGVTNVSSIADVVMRVNQAFHADAPEAYAVPASAEAAAQLLLAYELSLPQGLGLADRMDVNRTSSKVTMVVQALTTTEMRGLTGRAEQWLVDHAPDQAAPAVSPVVLFSHMSEQNSKSMVWGNIASLVLISLLLIFALADLRLGLLSIIPNVLPIVFAYGLWAITVHRINIVSSIAAAVCLGIVVDDTIHFLTRYQTSRAEGRSVHGALVQTMGTVGTALVLTSTILVTGFAVLTTSTFSVNSIFGQLVILVVLFALAADLLVLPAGLALVDRDRAQPRTADAPQGTHPPLRSAS